MKTLLALIVSVPLALAPAIGICADDQAVVVTVNDLPITNFDIDQRIQLWSAIGHDSKGGDPRKEALQSLVDDMIKRAEAKKWKAEATSDMVDAQIDRMAKASGTDTAGLTAKLKGKGVSMAALKNLVTAQLSFNRLLNALYKVKVEIDPAEVDKKYQEVAADPRLKPVPIYEIVEVTLPVDKTDDSMAQQLLMARAADAAQFARQFRGCGSLRQAASGIYNVKIGGLMKADGRKLPPTLKAALDKAGTGKIIGPGRSPQGVQLIAFCGKSTVSPPSPSREQVQMM